MRPLPSEPQDRPPFPTTSTHLATVIALVSLCLWSAAHTGCREGQKTPGGSTGKHSSFHSGQSPSPPHSKKDPQKDPTPDPGFVRCAKLQDSHHPKGTLSLGDVRFQRRGFTLTFKGDHTKKRLCFGVVSGARHRKDAPTDALAKAAHELSKRTCEAVLVLGNMGRSTDALLKVYRTLARTKRPLLVLPGATEHMKAYTKALVLASLDGIPVVDLSKIRVIHWPQLTLISVPGHHRHQALGAGWWACGFTPGDVSTLASHLQTHPPPNPVLLASHVSPLQDSLGPFGFDLGYGGAHGGSRDLTSLAVSLKIRFTVSAQIAEAGPAAVDPLGAPGEGQIVKPSHPSPRLWLHPGAMGKPLSGPNPGHQNRKKTGDATILCFQKKGRELLASYEPLTLH